MRTFWQIFFTAVITTTITVLLFFNIASRRYEAKLLRQMETEHTRISERMAKEISLFFEQTLYQLRLSGDILNVLKLDRHGIELTLNEVIIHSPHFLEVHCFNDMGMEIATSNPGMITTNLSSDSPEMVKSLKGENWISDVFFNENRIAFINISVPLYDLQKPVGLLKTKMSLKKLWWWIDETNSLSASRLSVVETAHGRVVADEKKVRLGRVHPLYGGIMRKGINETPDGRKFISVHDIPGVGMEIITESAMQTFMDQISEMRDSLALLVILLLALAAAISAASASRTAKPLRKVVEDISEYALTASTRMSGNLPGEYRQIASAFNQMADSLEEQQKKLLKQESLAAIGRTLAAVAHEIRHGLNNIINLIYGSRNPHDPTYDQVKTEIADMNVKIGDLLEFSRAGTLNVSESDSERVLWEASEIMRSTLESKGYAINIRPGMEKVPLHADIKKLSIAISNLIRNSMEAGGQGTHVYLDSRKVDGSVVFEVQDNGPGIPESIREKIFEPFYTTKERGFGLGLSIVETVAAVHGGRVSLESKPGEGTCFRIIIPETREGGGKE